MGIQPIFAVTDFTYIVLKKTILCFLFKVAKVFASTPDNYIVGEERRIFGPGAFLRGVRQAAASAYAKSTTFVAAGGRLLAGSGE